MLDPKDVNIGAELERLYKSKVFKAKKDEADRNPNENQKIYERFAVMSTSRRKSGLKRRRLIFVKLAPRLCLRN